MSQSNNPVISSIFSIAISSNSALAPLISAARDIFRITQASGRKEWLDFGEYVQNLVHILLRTLESNQSLRSGGLGSDFQIFQRTLEKISKEVARINTSLGRWFRYRTLDVEGMISAMRRRLDDAISSFLVRAMLELLSRAPSTDNSSARGTLPGRRSEASGLSLSSSLNRRRGPSKASQPRRSHIPRSQISNPQLNTVTAPESQFCNRTEAPLRHIDGSGQIDNSEFAACPTSLNQSERPLIDPANEETHANPLAATLYRLSNRMASAGDLEDALALSQGAARLYKAQAERQLALYYQN